MTFIRQFVIFNGIACVLYTLIAARYYWRTRRIIPRRDAPTHGRWVHPAPWR